MPITREQKSELPDKIIETVRSVFAFNGGPIRTIVHKLRNESFKKAE